MGGPSAADEHFDRNFFEQFRCTNLVKIAVGYARVRDKLLKLLPHALVLHWWYVTKNSVAMSYLVHRMMITKLWKVSSPTMGRCFFPTGTVCCNVSSLPMIQAGVEESVFKRKLLSKLTYGPFCICVVHRLPILSNFPETTRPSVYQCLLPEIR